MKKFAFVIIAFALILNLSGCNTAALNDYKYDDEGRVIQRPISSSVYACIEYDENGNIKTETEYYKSDESIRSISYYENGVKVSEKRYSTADPTFIIEDFFDEKGQVIRENDWQYGELVSYELRDYDERGNVTFVSRVNINDSVTGTTSEWQRFERQFDTNNDLIREDEYRYGEHTYYSLYEYSAPGVRKSYKQYTPSGHILEEALDDNGNKLWFKTYTYDSGSTPRVIELITYNSESSFTQVTYLLDGRTITNEYENSYIINSTYRDASGNILATCSSDGAMKDANSNDMGINQFAYESQDWYCPIVYPED